MFAVFYKGDFVDWWLNTFIDIGWVERTCMAKSWNPIDVEVYYYLRERNNADLFSFDEAKNLLILSTKKDKVKKDDGSTQEATVIFVKETWKKKAYFLNGNLAPHG